MQYWRPIPQALLTELLMKRWDKDNTAPEAVVFMVAIDRIMSGNPWSARKLGDYAGWSRWKANRMIEDVKAFVDEWNGIQNRPTFTEGAQPPMMNNVHNLHGQTDRKPATNQPKTSHHAPAINNNKTTQEQTGSIYTVENERGIVAKVVVDGGSVRDGNDRPKPKADQSTKAVERDDRLNALWLEMEQIRLKACPGSRQRKLGKRRQTFKLRVAEHGDQSIVKAWKWFWESNDQRAQFLRAGGYGIQTFLRAEKLRDYVDKADEWNPDADVGGTDWFTDDDFDEHGNLKAASEGE